MTNNRPLFSINYSLSLILIFLVTPLVLAAPLIIAQLLGHPIIDDIGLTAANFYVFMLVSQAVSLILIAILLYRKLHTRADAWFAIGIKKFHIAKAVRYILGYYCLVLGLLILIAVIAAAIAGDTGASTGSSDTSSIYGSIWTNILITVLIAPIVEEVLFRGVLFSALREKYSVGLAILFTGLIFSFAHIGNPVQAVGMLPMGIYLGYMRYKLGSIIPGIILHASWNALVLLAT